MARRRKFQIQHAEVVRLFADKLRAIRLSRGMTQAELARQAGVTPTYVSRLESGHAAPGIDLVDRLATALGTTLADLLPASSPPDDLLVLKKQATRMLDELFSDGDRETFLRLNPFLALLVEASSKRS